MAGEVAQGIEREASYKKQTAKGTPASGSGGQLLRRTTWTPNVQKETYSSNEIVSHQQHTGDIHGIARSALVLNGELSPLTYADFMASLLRKAAVATAAISSLTLTIAASGTVWTVTRSAGDWLADGVKVGDVGRLSGANLNAANVGVNLVVISMTATVLTVAPLNGKTLIAESAKAASTFTVRGKKIWVPTTGHINEYYTMEDWFSDLNGGAGRSHLYSDMQVASLAITMPTTGIITSNFNFAGLGKRTKGATRILTSPTAETTTPLLSAVSGVVLIGASVYAIITQADFTIDGQVAGGQGVVGSNTLPDNQRGKVKVTGNFSYMFVDDTLATPFENETVTDLTFVFAVDKTDAAEFVVFRMPEVKLLTDDGDDGEKQIVRTASFTAQPCSTGGAALANHQTIVSIQDSTIP